MKRVAEDIPAYDYGKKAVAVSPVTLEELAELKQSVQFTQEDERFLRLAGEVLGDQTKQIVDYWRGGIIASIPHLAKHSRTPESDPLPEYLRRSSLRFEQWILDTCQRPYDQNWLNYQQEIALRHTSAKKNQADGVRSTPHVPYRDIVAFAAVLEETIRPFLAAKGHSDEQVEGMRRAWQKTVHIQIALWGKAYQDGLHVAAEW